jgi:hypothetical protein
MGAELEVPEGWLPWWQRDRGGTPVDGGHHPSIGIMGTFEARGTKDSETGQRVLVFGVQEPVPSLR